MFERRCTAHHPGHVFTLPPPPLHAAGKHGNEVCFLTITEALYSFLTSISFPLTLIQENSLWRKTSLSAHAHVVSI